VIVPSIPEFLSHRPVFEGRVVPYVAIWSDERARGVANLQRWRGIDFVYAEKPTGVPEFGATNSHRQRNCMRRGWCQICGRPGADMYVIIDDRDIDSTHVGLWKQGMILNAPLHEECFLYAKRACPHLQRVAPYAIHRSDTPMPVRAYTTDIFALPIGFAPQGVIGREVIVQATT